MWDVCSVWLTSSPRAPGFTAKLADYVGQPPKRGVPPSHPALTRTTHASPELLRQVCACALARAGGGGVKERECVGLDGGVPGLVGVQVGVGKAERHER